MKARVLCCSILAAAGLALAQRQTVVGQGAPDGSVKGLAAVLAWAPQSVRDVYTDAGYTLTTQGPYVLVRVRAWFDPTTQTVGFPRMPDGLEVLRIRRAGAGCAVPALCVDDGPKVDPVDELPLDCACSSGSQCRVPNPDGGPGGIPAPLGATFDTSAGAGCVPKSCIVLFREDGSDWPYASCPCPSLLPDGGGKC